MTTRKLKAVPSRKRADIWNPEGFDTRHPFVGDCLSDTLSRLQSVCTFLAWSSPERYGDTGDHRLADGRTIIMEAVVEAIKLQANVMENGEASVGGGDHA